MLDEDEKSRKLKEVENEFSKSQRLLKECRNKTRHLKVNYLSNPTFEKTSKPNRPRYPKIQKEFKKSIK